MMSLSPDGGRVDSLYGRIVILARLLLNCGKEGWLDCESLGRPDDGDPILQLDTDTSVRVRCTDEIPCPRCATVVDRPWRAQLVEEYAAAAVAHEDVDGGITTPAVRRECPSIAPIPMYCCSNHRLPFPSILNSV